MVKWHIKAISELTNTSIRMLRHYDKIGLLKPTYREPNGYRCYTEQDLAKLQQIIALKFFGFDLKTIQEMLQKHHNIYAHLQTQRQVIKKQRLHLQQVHQALEGILSHMTSSASPDWQDLLILIKGYHMTNHLREQLKDSWAGRALTDEQFEEYLFIYEQFPKEFAMRDAIIDEINQKKVGIPEGPDGERIASFVHELAKKLKRFSAEQIKFSASLLERIRSGQLTQLELTPEGTHWVSRAILSHWLNRWNNLYETILKNLNTDPTGAIGTQLAGAWREIIEDYSAVGSRDFMMGLLLWQELARQADEVKHSKTIPPQEMIKSYHVPLLFNAEALTWINQALDASAKEVRRH